jgi:translation elongation factor EF-1beta
LNLDNIIKIDLITDKPLFKIPQKIKFANNEFGIGEATADNHSIYEQFEINIDELRNNIKNALKHKTQISFIDFIKEFPIQKGIAEMVAYMEIASQEKHKYIVDEEIRQTIDIQNIKTDKTFKIEIPQIIFCK